MKVSLLAGLCFFVLLIILELKNTLKEERKEVIHSVLGISFLTLIFFIAFVAINGVDQ